MVQLFHQTHASRKSFIGLLGHLLMDSSADDCRFTSLVYVSKAVVDFDDYKLERLVSKAGARNTEYDITGYLCFFGNCFLQFIEGSSESVKKVMENIRIDDRHQIVNVVNFPLSNRRYFPDWRMRVKKVGSSSLVEIQLEHILLELIKGATDKSLDDGLKQIMLQILEKIADNQSHL